MVTTTELTITEQAGRDTVNARELHANLGLTGDFSDWMRRWIKSDNLIEGVDYTILSRKERVEGGQGGGAVIIKEYFVITEIAKLKAASCNNKIGKSIVKQLVERDTKRLASPNFDIAKLEQLITQVVNTAVAAAIQQTQKMQIETAATQSVRQPLSQYTTVYAYMKYNYPKRHLDEISEHRLICHCKNFIRYSKDETEHLKAREDNFQRTVIGTIVKREVTFKSTHYEVEPAPVYS